MNVYVKGEHNAHETEDCQNKQEVQTLKSRPRHMGWSGTDEKTDIKIPLCSFRCNVITTPVPKIWDADLINLYFIHNRRFICIVFFFS